MSAGFVADYLREAGRLLAAIDPESVDAFVGELFAAWQRGSTVYTCGNGGSAATARHLAADLFRCTAVDGHPRMRALSLNDNAALLSALTNDAGWDAVYVEQLRTWWRPGDVVVGISVHGGVGSDRAGTWSRNVVGACAFAREHDGRALAFVGFDGGVLATSCDACVLVPAASTPHTEGIHVVLHHLVTMALRARIERA